MKLLSRLLTFSLLTVSSTIAQTVTDDFSTSANWTSLAAGQQGTSSLTISGGQVNYISSSPASNNSSVLAWNATTLSYLTSWSAQVDVHARVAYNPLETGDLANYFYGSLVAFDAASLAGPPNLMSADIMRPHATTNAFQISYYVSGTKTEAPNSPNGIANDTTDAALRLTFNSSTKVLSAYYDADGAVGGYNWTVISSINIAGAQNWSMTGGDTFTLGLEGTSGINLYAAGDVYFDNFSVTAVPEPSTSAALIGLATLGLATYRRRQRQAR